MAKAVNPFATWPYILEEDREALKENPEFMPTIWRLGPLNHRQAKIIKDNSFDAGGFGKEDGMDAVRAGIKQGSIMMETVRFGVKGWDHLEDEDGNVIVAEFREEKQGGGLTNNCMDYIHPWAAELCAAIQERNSVSLDDLKN